ncbi:MAG TPA: PASTA domain-containing protein, partial [Acidimicrobiia bacterium]
RNGVVHRDVKPGNILLTPQGQVKVTDFGIARAAGTSEGLTQTGSVMGTATYFSPEQAQGLSVDARSDVYSLGVVLYEMVCAIPPFTGESPISVAYKHVREEPPRPMVVNPDVPPALENIILTAMSKSPEGRYASADDMRADLARFRRGEQTTSVPLAAVPVTGADVTVANPRLDKVYDRTTVGTVVASPTIPQAPRRSAAPFVLALVALLAVLAGLGYLLARQLSGNGSHTALVPVANYVGQTQHDAELLIENAGLKPDSTTEENDQIAAGQVVSQDPQPGTKIDKGGTVKLKISAGKGQVKVPDVTGQSLDDAQSQLRDAGLDYNVQQETSDSVDAGKVTRTDPPGGTQAAKGAVIQLFVSLGKAQVTIPDVSGQDPATAGNTLGAKGLSISDSLSQASDSVDAGKVIGTNPPAGTSVPKNSKVQLIISTGPEQIRVPNVVGLSKADATTELQNAGFTVITRDVTVLDPNSAGRVIAQSPQQDSKATKGSSVTISVGKFGTSSSSSSTTGTTTFP